ncbi:MAG: DUF58 domain-containing protein [Planctomycetota bacterium]|nr:DUF58 domain-containing protein [Planctomycetota bacterium]
MKSRDAFFDSELIARLSRMEITARRIVDGFLAGKNRSSHHGHSVEFVEHREYAPGDDLRHLDWKVLARMDRYYVKRYEEETNITAILLLDASASMAYASGDVSKFERGAMAAAALGHLLKRQRDAVGLALFDSELRVFVPPSAKLSGLADIVAKLRGSEPRGKSALEPVFRKISPELPGRCLFVLISDLFLPFEEIDATLKFLHYHGHDLLVLHVLDVAERNFPFRSNILFRGLEDGRRLLAEPQRLRRQYLEALEEFLTAVRKACEGKAFDYTIVDSVESLGPALVALLAARSRRRRHVVRKGGR